MNAKVLYYGVNRLYARDCIPLDLKTRQQVDFGKSGKNFGRLLHGSTELVDKRRGGNMLSLREFGRSVANVRCPVKRSNQPLSNIAIQVQE